MAVFLRLAGNKICPSQIMNIERQTLLLLVRQVTIKPFPEKPPSTADYDERNMKLGRPQSPHLSVYAPRLTSMLSITHRMTGAALAVLTSTLGIGALVSPKPLAEYIDAIESLDLPGPLFLGAKAILAFPMAYHLGNGIRHLTWDTGTFITIKEVYMTGYIMVTFVACVLGGMLCL